MLHLQYRLLLYHSTSFNKVSTWSFLKPFLRNVCKELQVRAAGKGYPQILSKCFIILTYLKAKFGKNSPHGKNSWPEDYWRLPYLRAFLSNIIYNPFTPVPSPTGVRVVLACNLPFVICSLSSSQCEWGCCSAHPAQRRGNARRPGIL